MCVTSVRSAKLRAAVVPIEQIDRDVPDPAGRLPAAPRQADHVPVAERREVIDQIAPDHPLRTDHQSNLVACAHDFLLGEIPRAA